MKHVLTVTLETVDETEMLEAIEALCDVANDIANSLPTASILVSDTADSQSLDIIDKTL